MLRRSSGACLLFVSLLGITGACTSPTGPSRIGPSAAGVSPNRGTTFGGTAVTISGANFFAPVSVSFGGTNAANVVLVNPSTITAVAPVHTTGTVDVLVVANNRSAMLRGGFVYESPTVINTPPRVDALNARGRRRNEPPRYADIDELVDVTAVVNDNETPAAMFTYQWTASAGTIAGTGAAATFTAPHTAALVPVTLTVVERYLAPDATGLPVESEHRVSRQVSVSVHDERKEVSDMAKDFLVMFSQSSVPPAMVVRNFLDGCGANGTGKQDEMDQIAANRQNFVIVEWFVGDPRTTIDFGGVSPFRARQADAWSSVDVRWKSQCLKKDASIGCPSIGYVGTEAGVDWVTARYDTPTDRWWLCDSDYNSSLSLWPNLGVPRQPYLR